MSIAHPGAKASRDRYGCPKKMPKTFTDLMNFSGVGGFNGVNVIDVGLY